ncbi:MAG: hypothetical protein QM730_18965 [Anaerolineales bacterium]
MTQNRKNSGMTSAQIGILIGLGALVLILFGLMVWLVFGGSLRLPSFSRAPENTPTPQMTSTPVIFNTMTPTATATPIPYEQLIPSGWKQFKTELVEIWLPPSFKAAKKEPEEELSMVGETSKNSLYQMRVLVYFKPMVGDSLETFIDSELKSLDPQIRITENRKVSVNSRDAVRISFEMRAQGVDVNERIYVFQDGSTIWLVGYVAQINEFFDMLPTFDQSIKTFRPVQ